MEDIIIEKTVLSNPIEADKLMGIWEQSVRQTHLF